MANQYFLECFWTQALGFLVVRADGTQGAVQGTSQAPWQSSSIGCRVCTQELSQPFRSLSPHLCQSPGPCPAPTSTALQVREPWAGVMPPFQLQETRSRETKHPEFSRLLTAGSGLNLPSISMDFLAILHVPGGLTEPGGIKGKIKSQQGLGAGSTAMGASSHMNSRHLSSCAAGWPHRS